ncbi:class I SAM-dependent methyltransferase [Phaeobacter sp. B1627]|uniref:class I SAM-dependent methyltransferase n=1 Tax=Phaeobacter sp. B1627 TaxID=2583809 RepID=UPI00111A3B57|nr:class I SAM-dependent methyltransferase [Phaeobacter sp. B1627]TNJ42312.1 class I SAM-dependent methyltransferase [Phaeobacter sp. B1627]
MQDIDYDDFLSDIYDDSPFFGRRRVQSLQDFNRIYFDNLALSDKILELGSATGLLTVDLARSGYTLTSIDIAPSMHRVLERKLAQESQETRGNVTLLLDDATTFQGPEPYDAIVMSEGLVIALPNKAMQRALFENCRRNLRPGGLLITDFFQPYYKAICEEGLTEYTRFRTADGTAYMLTVSFENEPHEQRQSWQCTYRNMAEDTENAAPISATVHFCYVLKAEMELLLELTGFKVLQFNTDYAEGRGFSLVAERL